jgi:hypothetical protein
MPTGLAVGPCGETFLCAEKPEADGANHCTGRGRQRLSPPRGVGWEPVNALPPGILQS